MLSYSSVILVGLGVLLQVARSMDVLGLPILLLFLLSSSACSSSSLSYSLSFSPSFNSNNDGCAQLSHPVFSSFFWQLY